MNLMEIGKEPEITQKETTEETKNFPDTIDRWKQLAQEQAKALETVTAERDDLQIRCQDMEEFLLKLQEKMNCLKRENQKFFFENREKQREIQRMSIEIRKLTAGLHQKQKMEKEIEDIRNRNSKLKLLVDNSSVRAVRAAIKKQVKAEKQLKKVKCQLKETQEIEFLWVIGYVILSLFVLMKNTML